MNFDYDVFLSFSNSDALTARKIWKQLTDHQLIVFWSDNTLKREIGDSWFNKVEESLEQSQHMVVLITQSSLKSEWVLREYKAFLNFCYKENYRRLVPLLDHGIQVSDLPLFMREFQSFRLDEQGAIRKLGELMRDHSDRLKLEDEKAATIKGHEVDKMTLKEEIQDVDQELKPGFETGEFLDLRDQNLYRTVKTGRQVWFAENLRFHSPESRLYKDLEIHNSTYGRLYHWWDIKTACPEGWRIPDYSDWDELILALGGYNLAGEQMIHSSFSALYGGMALRETFGYIKRHAYFWSIDEYDVDNAWRYALYINEKEVNKDIRKKELFYSVRCIRNS